jgi:nucleoside phosphorylase
MVADRKWVKRNVGFDPIAQPAPPTTFSFTKAAATSEPEDLQREIIDFDSEGPEGKEFFAFTTATGLSRFTDIPWPKQLQPLTDKTVRKGTGGRLPNADVLVVTWTVDEGHATSRVLTPGKDSRNDYVPYTRNFAQIAKKMQRGCPALEAKRLGAYWTATIGSKKVVVFKSESHMSQDGPKLPNIDVWAQTIGDAQPQLVITTGTAGGIGRQFEVGDVIVSPIVRFDCVSKFKSEPFHSAHYSSVKPNGKLFAQAKQLFKANSDQLPRDNTRMPQIVPTPLGDLAASVVTTDFFGFDTSDNHFKLKGLGHVSEMGDAVLGLVAQQLKEAGKTVPRWVAIRNVSDPQIKAEGTIKQQANVAAQIYKAFGRWSTVCSAIVCWALIAAEK